MITRYLDFVLPIGSGFVLLLNGDLSDFVSVYSLCVSLILSLRSERVRWVCALSG